MTNLPTPGDIVFVKCIVKHLQIGQNDVKVVVQADATPYCLNFMPVDVSQVFDTFIDTRQQSLN